MMHLHQKSVKVTKHALLTSLRNNQEQHAKDYEEAIEDYRLVLSNALSEAAKTAQIGPENKVKDITKNLYELKPPQDHRDDYTNVIEMLEYSVDNTIELDEQSFKAYVKNEWSWTATFTASGSFYKTASAQYK